MTIRCDVDRGDRDAAAASCQPQPKLFLRPIVAAGQLDTIMAKVSLFVVLLVWSLGCSDGRGSTPPPDGTGARNASLAAATPAPSSTSGDSAVRGTAARTASMTPDSGDAQWVIPAKNYASTRYSGLNQIRADNVSGLKLAWTFSTAVNRGHEAAPLVVGGTMYVVTPYPNILYALDLTQPGGPLKWKYEPHPAAAAQGVACCDVVNRGAAYFD
jgi:glucose dehydrogenase